MPIRPILIIVMLIIALVLGVTLVWPKFQDFKQVRAEVEQKEAELNSKTEYYFIIQEIWGRLEGYADVLTQIDAALQKGYSIPALFNYLQQTAGQTGLILEDLTFKGVSGDKVKEISINLRVSGSYSAFQNFISYIQ